MDNDDTIGELIKVCDSEPRAGLEWIAHLDDDLSHRPLIMFAKFTALRHLALDPVFERGFKNFSGLGVDEVGAMFCEEQLDFAESALSVIREIEHRDPDYLLGLDTNGDQWAYAMVDSVSIPLETLRPGAVQGVLGWTKLSYLGLKRIGFAPGLIEKIPTDIMNSALNAKIHCDDVFRSAIGATFDERTGSISFQLLRDDYHQAESIGDAGMLDLISVCPAVGSKFAASSGKKTRVEPDSHSEAGASLETRSNSFFGRPVWQWFVGGIIVLWLLDVIL